MLLVIRESCFLFIYLERRGRCADDDIGRLQGVIAAYMAPYGFVGFVSIELSMSSSFLVTPPSIHSLTNPHTAPTFHTTPLTTDATKVALVTLPSANPAPNFELTLANGLAPFWGVIAGYGGNYWGTGSGG